MRHERQRIRAEGGTTRSALSDVPVGDCVYVETYELVSSILRVHFIEPALILNKKVNTVRAQASWCKFTIVLKHLKDGERSHSDNV